jgi:conjugal transfer pilus assembly protein TraB
MQIEKAPLTNRKIKLRQRVLAIAIFASLIGLAAVAVMMTDSPSNAKSKQDEVRFSIRPENSDKDALIARYDSRFAKLERELEETRRLSREKTEKLQSTIERQEKTIARQAEDLQDLGKLADKAGLQELAEKPANEKNLSNSTKNGSYRDEFTQDLGRPFRGGTPAEWASTSGAYPQESASRLVKVTLRKERNREGYSEAGQPHYEKAPLLKPDAPLTSNRAVGASVRNYIPAGTFTSGRLLTGVYAATGAGAASQPLPMLIRVEDKAILPNSWRSDVESCHITANAAGDLSSERVFVRLDRLSCVSKKGKLLDVRVVGYLTGEDGKVGVRGKLVTRSGQAIASAISVGLLSGVGSAVSQSSENITTSITGTQTKSWTNPWASGLGKGFSDAMDRIADYYLKLADRIFPVLEVDAGRKVDIVFSQGVLLSGHNR